MKKLTSKKELKRGYLNSETYPTQIDYKLFEDNILTFSDGTKTKPTCINCLDHPCINYSLTESRVDLLPEMPYNHTLKVCPVDAIKLAEDGFPGVVEDLCIGCGICLNRCDIAAINISASYKAAVSREENPYISFRDPITDEEASRIHSKFNDSEKHMLRSKISERYFASLYQQLAQACRYTPGFDNLLVRNLLFNLGVKTKIRAIGNNDIRFDMVGTIDRYTLIAEIGLNGSDILEEPRAILDDIAVLHSRYGFDKNDQIAVIVTLTFPNKRSDGYEVFSDIENVFGIRVFSIPAHFLIITNLLRCKVEPLELLTSLYVNRENKSTLLAAISLVEELTEFDPFAHETASFYQAAK